MVPLKRSVALSYMLSIWTLGFAKSCGKQQTLINGLCCDQCPPGNYVKKFCTENKTVCSPCPEDYFSDDFNSFDRCEECQRCQQDYAEKCTSTTNARCSCGKGFLCSNNKCLTCEKNKCVLGETVKRTDNPAVGGLIKYSYMCIACPAHEYFDVKEETCKPRTRCSTSGLAEQFPGNKTHNSVCIVHGQMLSRSGDSTHIILSISFLLLSLCFIVFLSTVFVKNQRKHKPSK
nr:PREDICTED: tumor necrosis factor receptor superfamily member 3-like [Paralichthys olivaceus]